MRNACKYSVVCMSWRRTEGQLFLRSFCESPPWHSLSCGRLSIASVHVPSGVVYIPRSSALSRMSDEQIPSTSGTQKKRKIDDFSRKPLTEDQLLRHLLESDEENFDSTDDESWNIRGEDDETDSSEDSGDEAGWETPAENLPAEEDPESALPASATRTPITYVGHIPDRREIPFTKNPGLKVGNPGSDPFDYFCLLANDDFFDLVIQETNFYANELLKKNRYPRARITEYRNLTRGEFETFLGLIYLMGIVRLPSIPDYWKRLEYIFDFPCFRSTISRDRFQIILRCMHFGRNPGVGDPLPSDPLYKIRPLLNLFTERMKEIYYPGKELCLDESMLLWRGRLSFRQYIQNKRHQHGIKLYMLSEPNGLIQDIIVYTGAKDPDVGGRGHSNKVVRKLMDRFFFSGHSLYMNNYYNSVELSCDLLKKDTYTTGTLRSNRKYNPPQVLRKKLKRGESMQQYTSDGICVLKWNDKRDVLMVSSEFNGDLQEVNLRGEKTASRPKMVVKYNTYMGGVDRADQLMAYYPLERKSLRWYLKVALHVFHLMQINSYILYNIYSGKRMTLKDFRISVIRSLIKKK
ncbi:piggyBac transposable element-derived protein 4-like [Ischnura elegans]|uniref:piggyBac transposable element-derived protein 4-like n=1 Tax=Ischnura elegans TaxID=197161 RepID=UPI001ED8BB32|nr:piggyBac transposable element-derived protein 4-like [Ischnura elegans]